MAKTTIARDKLEGWVDFTHPRVHDQDPARQLQKIVDVLAKYEEMKRGPRKNHFLCNSKCSLGF
jgi:hypothetical protein